MAALGLKRQSVAPWLLPLVLSLTLACLLGACGKKGPPLAPLRLAPPRVSDLEALQRGDRVVLSWSVPEITREQAPDALRRLELFMALHPDSDDGDGDDGSPLNEAEFERLSGRVLQMEAKDVQSVAGTAWLERALGDDGVAPRSYGVRYISRSGGRARLSNLVKLTPGTWPEPPPAPRLELVEDGILVDVAEEAVDIYKRDREAEQYPPRPLFAGQQGAVRDMDSEYGQVRCYVAARLDQGIESPLSEEACIQVKDLKPPQPPEGLAAAADPRGGVLLLWSPSSDPDVAGYHVYRLQAGSEDLPIRLTRQPLDVARYTDTTAGSALHEYYVTAVDGADPPNESAPSEHRRAQSALLRD
jgi:hypothetical protein